jgi:hypothetical protein
MNHMLIRKHKNVTLLTEQGRLKVEQLAILRCCCRSEFFLPVSGTKTCPNCHRVYKYDGTLIQ